MGRMHRTVRALSPNVRLLSLAVLLACASPLAAQKLGEVPIVPPTSSAEKGKTLEWVSAEGRPYWYRLPEKIDARKPPNLVIMLHGTGLNWGWSFWNYPIGNGKFRSGDIVVSPDGLTPGQSGTFNFIQGKKDGDQIAGLIRLFRGRFPIDKVYLYGHSQGAFFAYWFAGEHTELVDGIVAHAGNVLQVKHHELAKEKVAIAILHGEADAVVPVECAHRSHKIYEDQGYKKLKLEIVEDLTAQSGHWPLPKNVAALLDWLDEVSVDSPALEVRVALDEIAKESPDLLAIGEAIAEAKSLLGRYRGDDKKELEARVDLIEGFIEEVAKAHAAAIDEASRAEKDDEFAAWMSHFAAVHPALSSSKEWRSKLRKWIQAGAKQDQLVAQAVKLLDTRPGRAAFLQAAKVVENAPLASDAHGLIRFLKDAAGKEKGISAEDVATLEKAIGHRATLESKGREQAAAITAKLAKELREKNAALLGKKAS